MQKQAIPLPPGPNISVSFSYQAAHQSNQDNLRGLAIQSRQKEGILLPTQAYPFSIHPFQKVKTIFNPYCLQYIDIYIYIYIAACLALLRGTTSARTINLSELLLTHFITKQR